MEPGSYNEGEGGGLYIEDSAPILTNVIIHRNIAPVGDGMYITGTGVPLATYSDIQGGYAGEGNIDADPLFTSGPEGDYYLSQVDAGQAADSPCLDTGSDPAADVCFEGAEGVVCLDQRMTRTDALVDIGQVDMGFHFDYRMVEAALSRFPPFGTVPFTTQMTVSLGNRFPGQFHRIHGHIHVTDAAGNQYRNWRVGYANVAAGASYVANFPVTIPALGSVIGDNVFALVAEDRTPPPYNQPPYPPAGDSATATCTVTGIAP